MSGPDAESEQPPVLDYGVPATESVNRKHSSLGCVSAVLVGSFGVPALVVGIGWAVRSFGEERRWMSEEDWMKAGPLLAIAIVCFIAALRWGLPIALQREDASRGPSSDQSIRARRPSGRNPLESAMGFDVEALSDWILTLFAIEHAPSRPVNGAAKHG